MPSTEDMSKMATEGAEKMKNAASEAADALTAGIGSFFGKGKADSQPTPTK